MPCSIEALSSCQDTQIGSCGDALAHLMPPTCIFSSQGHQPGSISCSNESPTLDCDVFWIISATGQDLKCLVHTVQSNLWSLPSRVLAACHHFACFWMQQMTCCCILNEA